MGTVEYCGLVVRVSIDGKPDSQQYSTDYWEPVPRKWADEEDEAP